MQSVPVVALLLLLALLVSASLAVLCVVLVLVVVAKPWDGDVHRGQHVAAQSAPYAAYWLGSWAVWLAGWLAALKPAPLRAAELAGHFVHSQVLFALSNLGIPDKLAGSSGPLTATQLAAAIGPSVPVAWLERLLSAAAAYGMLKRTRLPAQLAGAPGAAAAGDARHATARGAASGPASPCEHAYSLTAVTACLASQSPVCMSAFVRKCEFHYTAFAHLSQSMATGQIAYEISNKGATFWEFLAANPDKAATFDTAMTQVSHLGGNAAVHSYAWRRFDCVIDVAGGFGGFTADLLRHNPGLRDGIVFDLPAQIARADELWDNPAYSDLRPRVQLVAGDMFKAATIPAPPRDSRATAYVLRNILHDWPDEACIALLKAIRARAGDAASSTTVQLLVVEVTTISEVLPCHLPIRHCSDVVMLAAFGDGKERNKQQFEALFEASGWRLTGIKPTCSMFLVLEVDPL